MVFKGSSRKNDGPRPGVIAPIASRAMALKVRTDATPWRES